MSTIKTDPGKAGKADDSSANEQALVRPSASYSLTFRLKIRNLPGMLGKVTSLIGEVGGDIGAIDIAGFEKDKIIRDLTVKVRDSEHGEALVKRLNELEECEVVHVSDRTFLMHL